MNNLFDVLSEEFDENYFLKRPKVGQNNKDFKNKLCSSMAFFEKPSDLEEKWVAKLCPKGRRCLVVAHNNTTAVYNKYGNFIRAFPSDLPGGSNAQNRCVFTVLDCVYNTRKKYFFVIDVVAWNKMSLRQSDVEYRYYWLKTKLNDIHMEFGAIHLHNQYPFYEVETFALDKLEEKLAVPYHVNGDYTIKLQEILFYRKEVPYLMCTTPHIRWLKPFMVKNKLGIDVHESFEVPSGD